MQLPYRDDVWLFVTAVTPLPPVVWVTLARRMKAAGEPVRGTSGRGPPLRR